MKKVKMTSSRGIATGLLVVLTFSLSGAAQTAFADASISNKIVITPENLDEVLFANNPDAIRAMTQVSKAKDQVNIARAEVLPSLSLNLTLMFSNPPMFMVNSASCLVPFLFPGAWYGFAAAKHAAGAETMAFHIARLNVYSTAYALTTQVGGDVQILQNQEAHFARLDEYVKTLQLQADLGVISQADVMKGQLELGRMTNDLSKLRQLINDERAALRRLFGFTIDQDFDIAMTRVNESPFESQTPAASLSYIVARAPERRQIDQLIAQAQSQVHQAQWAFLAGCSGSQGSVSNYSAASAFSISTGLSINIGFGYYPRIQLARRNVEDMLLRQKELDLELGRVLETSVSDIAELKLRQEQSEKNAALSEQMLEEQNQLLPLGRVSVKEMLETYASISNSRVETVASKVGLDGHRITLKRVALEDGFLKVFINSRRQLELGGR
jgi:multidrug efflux system outer membrane protein